MSNDIKPNAAQQQMINFLDATYYDYSNGKNDLVVEYYDEQNRMYAAIIDVNGLRRDEREIY